MFDPNLVQNVKFIDMKGVCMLGETKKKHMQVSWANAIGDAALMKAIRRCAG